MSRSVIKMNIFMPNKPAISFWFMGIKVVQNHMDFFPWIRFHYLVHKRKKFPASPTIKMPRLNQATGNLLGSK